MYRNFQHATTAAIHLPGRGDLRWHNVDERAVSMLRVETLVKNLPFEAGMAVVDDVCGQLGDVPAERPAVSSWDELRALARGGVDLAPHTEWHPLLTHVSAERVATEVRASHAKLQQEIGTSPPAFSYPNGSHDDVVVDVVREAGFELAFTQINGLNDLRRCDPLRLCRTNVTRHTTLPILRMRLQGWFMAIDRWRKRKRYREQRQPRREAL